MFTIELEGKSGLVTGASQGIGQAVARALHRAGARVIINHLGTDETREAAEQLRNELDALRPGSAWAVGADISKPDQVGAMIQQIETEHGGLDILVNNAAILRDKTIKKMSLDEWDAVIAVNLSGVYHMTKAALSIMNEGGSIVSFGSIAAREGFFGQVNYASAKAGVEAMMRVVAREAGRRGIRANAIAPGVVETAMAAQIPESVRAEMLQNVPLGRFAKPEEIAQAVLFLCSPMASYITGATLEVNGGWRS